MTQSQWIAPCIRRDSHIFSILYALHRAHTLLIHYAIDAMKINALNERARKKTSLHPLKLIAAAHHFSPSTIYSFVLFFFFGVRRDKHVPGNSVVIVTCSFTLRLQWYYYIHRHHQNLRTTSKANGIGKQKGKWQQQQQQAEKAKKNESD